MFWRNRTRVASEPVIGAGSRIAAGEWGQGNPLLDIFDVNPNAGIYNFHQGDIFTPGAMAWAFEPTTELTPLQTLWGFGFARVPNTFNPFAGGIQVWSQPHVVTNGMGGLEAGMLYGTPLSLPSPDVIEIAG